MDYFPAPGRNHLFVPGPSNIPDRVLRELCRPNEDHRSPAFKIFSKTLIEDVKVLFNTHKSTCFIFPTTGTGTWESSLTNTLSPGDLILSFRFGQFSVLWIEQMKNLKFNVDIIDSSWGAGADLTALGDRLEADKEHKIKALCVVHNETSTGVTNNIGTIRAILIIHLLISTEQSSLQQSRPTKAEPTQQQQSEGRAEFGRSKPTNLMSTRKAFRGSPLQGSNTTQSMGAL